MKFQKIVIILIAAILTVNTAGIIYIAKEERAQSEMIYLQTHAQLWATGLKNGAEEDYAKLFSNFYEEYNISMNGDIK